MEGAGKFNAKDLACKIWKVRHRHTQGEKKELLHKGVFDECQVSRQTIQALRIRRTARLLSARVVGGGFMEDTRFA